MAKLITCKSWIAETFPEGGVGIRTVEEWILKGVIHGKIIGGKVFVDADKTALLIDCNTVISAQQTQLKISESSDLVSQIVAGAQRA